jgi:branched-subunit amino acid ABC-type transport system permease component
MALEKLIFAPLRKTGNSALPIMLSSIGAYIIFQNIVSMVFGDVTLSVRDWPTMPGHIFLGARISRLQGLDIIIPWTCLGFVWILLRLTPLGRQLRAVSEDPELAQIFGIDTKTTILWSTALGSGLAGLAGALASIDTDMVPTIGFYAFLLGVVASILGGRDSIIGAVLSGLLLGLIPQLGAWGIDTQWQDTIIFGVLVIFLALQPGAPMRAAISGLKASP